MSQKFKNLVEIWETATKNFSGREVFGTKRGGEWHWITYKTFQREVDMARAALAGIGIKAGDRVAIVSNNRVEWAALAYATYGLRAVYVPMYEAQTPDEWAFILRDCEAKVVFGSTQAIFEQLGSLRERVPSLTHVFGLDLPEAHEQSYRRLLETGKDKNHPAEQPAPDEYAGFIYTSGTTGEPKGVILSHGNFCANINDVHEVFPLAPDERSLSFLPWAHSFGQTAELHMLLSLGCSIGINDEIPNLVGNLSQVRPTILISVPRIFNRIYDGVNKQMAEKPAPIRSLFKAGIRAATQRSRGEHLSLGDRITLSLADKLIFNKIRARFGGRLKYTVSGSAALSREVAEFVDALGIDVYEGYGLTETSPVVSTNYPGARKIGSVGKPLPSVRVEIDRSVTGDDTNGEIVVRGPNVMVGYHNRPEENAKVLTPDHGLRTGDMGHLDADGYLYITGRIKEQYKLENGKYVVPSPLEEELKLSPYIVNVMLHGANKPYNVALIVPDVEALKKWAAAEGRTLGDVTRDEGVKRLIQAELEKYSQNFRGYEKPKAFVLTTEDFTTDNGMLTPSMKVRRQNVLAKYGAALESLYAQA